MLQTSRVSPRRKNLMHSEGPPRPVTSSPPEPFTNLDRHVSVVLIPATTFGQMASPGKPRVNVGRVDLVLNDRFWSQAGALEASDNFVAGQLRPPGVLQIKAPLRANSSGGVNGQTH